MFTLFPESLHTLCCAAIVKIVDLVSHKQLKIQVMKHRTRSGHCLTRHTNFHYH